MTIRKLALKDKLRKIKMEAGDSIPNYLTKFTHYRDELGSVGLTIAKHDMGSLALLSFPRVRIAMKTFSVGGRRCHIGNDYGRI